MSQTVVYQDPYVCDTIADMNQITIDRPNLAPMTSCTVLVGASGGIEVYRWWAGAWGRTYPDQATLDLINTNATNISGLQTSKADASTVTTLSSTVSSLSSAVAGKADSSTVTALAGTVSSLATTVSGKFNTPAGSTSQYVRGDGSLATFPAIPTNTPWVPAAASRSLVTGTGATGFQPNASKNTLAVYNVRTTSTASIAGNADGYIVLEVCPTNSATAGDWIEMARTSNSQVLTLAVTLNSVQGQGAALTGVIPAGWYAKLRQVTTTGTMAFAYVSGTETPMS